MNGSGEISLEDIEPIHAYGFFTVSRSLEFNQVIVFEYIDTRSYYASLSQQVDRLDSELSRMARRMQAFLDGEEVVVNGDRVRPRVKGATLGFRGEPEEPYLLFFIYFKGKAVKGSNYYENIYEGETAEYPYEVYWMFPPGSRIEEVVASGSSEIIGDNIVVIRVEEGDNIMGYEKIVFRL